MARSPEMTLKRNVGYEYPREGDGTGDGGGGSGEKYVELRELGDGGQLML